MNNYLVLLPVLLPLALGYASLHIKFENDEKRTKYSIICTAINSVIVFAMLFAMRGAAVNVFEFTQTLGIKFKIAISSGRISCVKARSLFITKIFSLSSLE